MEGDKAVIRNHLKTVLANCKKVGIVAVEINAGQFSDSCNLESQQIAMACDVLNEFSSNVLQHVGGVTYISRVNECNFLINFSVIFKNYRKIFSNKNNMLFFTICNK